MLTAELLCLVQNIAASATRTRHARHQMWVTESGVLWAKGCSIRVIKNLVFTFTSRRCRRQGPGDRLLARPGCAWSGSSLLLVLRLLCDGLEVRDFGLRGGGCVVALQPCLHVFDALLERLEFRGPALNDLLSVVGENGQVSFCALCSPDRRGKPSRRRVGEGETGGTKCKRSSWALVRGLHTAHQSWHRGQQRSRRGGKCQPIRLRKSGRWC